MKRRKTLILLLLAALAALGVALWLGMRDETGLRLVRQATSPLPRPGVKGMVSNTSSISASTFLEKPRYGGQAEDGQRWHLVADRATQTGTMASSTFLLDNLSADWQTAQSRTFQLSASKGEYAPDTQNLILTGTISATGGGLEILTPKATANLKTRQVAGTEGVRVNGMLGNQPAVLDAQTFSLDAGEGHLVFRGRVKLVLQGGQP